MCFRDPDAPASLIALRALSSLALGLILALFSGPVGAQNPPLTVGILADGPMGRLGGAPVMFEREMTALLSSDFDVSVPAEKRVEADWTVTGVEKALDRLLSDPEVNLVLVLGSVGARVAALRGDLPKPLIAVPVHLPELQNLPREGEGSGVRNLHYLTLTERPDVGSFQEIVSFRRVAVLIESAMIDAIPDLTERLEAGAAQLGLEPRIVPVGTSASDALAAIGQDVEAVYLLPLLRLPEAEFDLLVQGLIVRKLPSFSSIGREEVDLGVLAGLKTSDFIQRLARRTALNTQRILLGTDPGEIPVAFTAREALSINMATARAIEVYPPWKVLTEAELVADEEGRPGRALSLEAAVQEAVTVNLDLAARERDVAAGAEEVSLATSNLLPQIDLFADGVVIDEDRAAASLGSAPERVLTGGAQLTQLVFSEPSWANRSIQKSIQTSRELDRDAVRLDVAFDAAVTYLNILRAKTFDRIQRENLDLTRTNLELARVRQSIGTATPGEVYRWENQIANARQAVVNASSIRNQAEVALNRLLHRPLEEPFLTQETDLDDPTLMRNREVLFEYLDNPWSFRVFRQFMAQEAATYAPELKSIDALARAQQRAASSSSRRLWVPSLALQAGISERLAKGGAGSFTSPAQGLLDIPQRDDTDWFVGLNLSYPLLEGGARFADKRQAHENLARIETEREAAAERVEQRVRTALHRMGASLVGIDLSRDAAEAARKNYELVLEAYRRGAISILDLLDAQNVALVSEQDAASAVYDFLIDLMGVQRAAGRLDFFSSDEERQAFFQRLQTFFDEARNTADEQ